MIFNFLVSFIFFFRLCLVAVEEVEYFSHFTWCLCCKLLYCRGGGSEIAERNGLSFSFFFFVAVVVVAEQKKARKMNLPTTTLWWPRGFNGSWLISIYISLSLYVQIYDFSFFREEPGKRNRCKKKKKQDRIASPRSTPNIFQVRQ